MDFLLSIGTKPFVELSFMPKALALGDTAVFYRYTAAAIKRADAQLRGGGPATAKNEWVEGPPAPLGRLQVGTLMRPAQLPPDSG